MTTHTWYLRTRNMRSFKQLVPTGDGIKLIRALPDTVKSPQLTADWKNLLALVAKGVLPMWEFMGDIENMVKELVRVFGGVSEEKGSYDAYLIPEGVKEYSYTKDGKEVRGSPVSVETGISAGETNIPETVKYPVAS